MVHENITTLIGNTPLLKIDPTIHGLKNIDLYAKLELFNPFGSIKDRVAWGLIKDDYHAIKEEGKVVIESSSGNTAKGLKILTSVLGIDFKIITNRIKVGEVKGVLQVIGTDIEELPGLSECPDPTDPNDPIMIINNRISDEPNKYFHTSQYTNEKNPKSHYDSTGKEIYDDLGNVDYMIGSLGTTGSTKGTCQYLEEKNPKLTKVGVVSTKGDTIPGIRNMDELYEVGIFKKDFYNDIVVVDSMDSIEGALELASKTGILSGPTGGATYRGALSYLKKIDATLTERKKAVFIICDRLEFYISYFQKRRPDLFNMNSNKESIRTLTSEEISEANIINIQEANHWIKKSTPIIIDLRGSVGFKTNHIPGSINIQDSFFEDMIDSGIPFSNDQTILLVCPVGDNSRKFAALLKKKGFQSVFSLESGIVGWRDMEYPMERSNIRR